jgi:hypothetical protein
MMTFASTVVQALFRRPPFLGEVVWKADGRCAGAQLIGQSDCRRNPPYRLRPIRAILGYGGLQARLYGLAAFDDRWWRRCPPYQSSQRLRSNRGRPRMDTDTAGQMS